MFIQLLNISDIDNEVNVFGKAFLGKETEDNWESRNKAIQRFRGIFYEDNTILNNNIKLLKPVIDYILISVRKFLKSFIFICKISFKKEIY